MKILFIFCESLSAPPSFPLGIGLLSAILKEKGHVVKGIHVHRNLDDPKNLDAVAFEARRFEPDLIGYSSSTPAFPEIKKISRRLRQENRTVAICGGTHPTFYPEETLATEGIDFVCVGEGEVTLVEFVTALENGDNCSTIRGIWSLGEHGEMIKNALHPLVQDLDVLPWTDYDALGKDFIQQQTSEGWLRYLSSRGCPYDCSYCHTAMFRKVYSAGIGFPEHRMGYIRFRSVDSMLEEILLLIEKHKLKVINFVDDCFCLNRNRALEFCQKAKVRLPPHVGYSIQTNLRHLDDELIGALRNSRCLRVVVGVESGTERILQLLNRKTDPQQLKAKLRLLVKAQFPLGTWSLNMLGMPTETKSEMLETLRLNAQIPVERARFNIMAPYLGSRLFDFCVEQDLFVRPSDNLDFVDRRVSRLKFPDEERAFLERFFDIGHWYMNLYGPFGLESYYSPLIEEIERLRFGEWPDVKDKYLAIDDELSASLSAKAVPHYTFVLKEKVTANTIGLSCCNIL